MYVFDIDFKIKCIGFIKIWDVDYIQVHRKLNYSKPDSHDSIVICIEVMSQLLLLYWNEDDDDVIADQCFVLMLIHLIPQNNMLIITQ